ncbi:hypothetical protein [Ligilactobacillus pobuzihii]
MIVFGTLVAVLSDKKGRIKKPPHYNFGMVIGRLFSRFY